MNKITKLFKRYKNARQLGLSYYSTSSFHLPEKLDFHGKAVDLVYPDEKGVFIDFLSIFLDDDYQLFKFHRNQISTIIDIGANVGFFSLASRFYFPNSEIHAFEPNLNLKEYLSHNFSNLNIKLHSKAVGEKSGTVQLNIIGESNQTRVNESSPGSTEMITLESILSDIDGEIDLLKLDCEGSEWGILKDTESLKQVNNITLEYHLWANQKTHEDAKNLLTNHGFKIIKHLPCSDFGMICGKKK